MIVDGASVVLEPYNVSILSVEVFKTDGGPLVRANPLSVLSQTRYQSQLCLICPLLFMCRILYIHRADLSHELSLLARTLGS
jgi:hypothetical protein